MENELLRLRSWVRSIICEGQILLFGGLGGRTISRILAFPKFQYIVTSYVLNPTISMLFHLWFTHFIFNSFTDKKKQPDWYRIYLNHLSGFRNDEPEGRLGWDLLTLIQSTGGSCPYKQ